MVLTEWFIYFIYASTNSTQEYGGSSPCQPRGSNLQVDRLGLTDGRAPVAHAPVFMLDNYSSCVSGALFRVLSGVCTSISWKMRRAHSLDPMKTLHSCILAFE
jgi:hypothetical protein